MKTTSRITEGNILKQVVFFCIPIIIGAFFQHFYSIVDTIIVGKALGTIELSAVGGSASKIIVLLVNFFIGVSSGITALVSMNYGNKNIKKVNSVIVNGMVVFTALGIALSVLGIVFSDRILFLMKTPIETIPIASLYLRTYLAGIVFCVLYNMLSGVIRALGDSKRPLYVIMFCSILNITLDILFTIVFNMGVFGVAFATIMSQAVSVIALIRGLIKKISRAEITGERLDLNTIKDILSIGIPSGIQSIMFSLSNIVVQSGVNSFGTVSIASWSAYVKIDSIVDIFLSSLGSTAITFVGQNYGAGKMDRVKKSVRQIIAMSYVLVGLIVGLFILIRVPLISLFTDDKRVIELGSMILCVILPMYLLTIPQQIFSQALRGLGKSFIPMVLTLIGVIGVRLIWVWVLLPKNPQLTFLGLCYPFSALLMSLIFSIYYYAVIKRI